MKNLDFSAALEMTLYACHFELVEFGVLQSRISRASIARESSRRELGPPVGDCHH